MRMAAFVVAVLLAGCSPETNASLSERLGSSFALYMKAKQAGCENFSEAEKAEIRKLYPDPSQSICPEIE